MKIAIHHREGSFSERWIEYCRENGITYKIVNAFENDLIANLKDCDALMWHYHQGIYRDRIIAQKILFSLEQVGIRVFPNFKTAWHFDDKLGQKYMLEAINAPLVTSYVFYDKHSALQWIKSSSFPKVFKLRGGAGSANVSLVNSKREANNKVRKAFGKGFSQYDGLGKLKSSINRLKQGKDTLIPVLKAMFQMVFPPEFARLTSREKGYIYFQEFIPNNDSDIRIIVIGNKAFGIKRMVRKNDFRASGSGDIKYEKHQIPIECLELAFDINKNLKTQCIAFDFVFNKDKRPLVVEISYGFDMLPYDPCPGYWTSDLKWHNGKFNPQNWMIEDLINSI